MAKFTNCRFCGKELKKGFFTGEDRLLELGDTYITCCKDCLERYEPYGKRFGIKVKNYSYLNRTELTEQTILQWFRQYLAEADAYATARGTEKPTKWGYFYQCNENGVFGLNEALVGTFNGTSDKVKMLENTFLPDTFLFTRDDISCIRFHLCEREEIDMYHTAYAVEICLNEGFTFRPAYCKTVIGKSGVFNMKDKVRQEVYQQLEQFRARIGSDLPIEEVRSFRT